MATQPRGCEIIPVAKLHDWQIIGGGSFGVIYKAWFKDRSIDVAVKKLNSNVSQGLEELFSEASKMGKALAFPYIIKLYGIFEDKNASGAVCHGIVMEYLEYGSLASLLRRVKPVPLELKIRILHEVAVGMNFLHDLSPPLLHLDLKPSNILLDSDLHVRIADFGLSRFKRGTSLSPGASVEYGGTLEYMPPECLKEDNVNYRPTQKFDVYSYGILMWAVITGEEPYSAASPHVIKLRVPLGDRPDLQLLKDVESVEKLEELMQCCWDQEPMNRPTFRECSAETENISSAHKAGIVTAVRKVQDVLMKMVAPSTEDPSVPQVYSAPSGDWESSMASSTTTNSHMSKLVEEFKTMNFTETPNRDVEAVPIATSAVPSTARLDENPHPVKPCLNPCPPGSNCESPQTSYADTAPSQPICTGYQYYVPNPSHPGQYYPSMYPGHPQNQYLHWPASPLLTGPVSITATNIRGLQVGHNNIMNITSNSSKRDSMKKKKK